MQFVLHKVTIRLFMLLAFILVEGCQIHAGRERFLHWCIYDFIFFSLKLRSKFNDLYAVVCEAITKKFENHSWWFLELTSVDGHWWWFCFQLNSSVQFFTKDLLCISSNCQCGILSICIFFLKNFIFTFNYVVYDITSTQNIYVLSSGKCVLVNEYASIQVWIFRSRE